MALATTVDALMERVRRDASLGSYGPIYTLAATVDADDTEVQVSHDILHITNGSVLAVDTEIMRVTEIHHDTGMLSVVRGFWGSTAAAHTTGALIEQDPRYPKAALLDWAELEIRSWDKVLFRIVTLAPLAVTTKERAYDLVGVNAQGVSYLLDVRSPPLNTNPVTDFGFGVSWTGDSWPRVEAKLLRNMPVADFPSGYALQLKDYPRHAADLRVVYASPFNLSTFTAATDLVATVGLDTEWLDILEAGLRRRALEGSMQSRTDWRAVGMNRESEDVSLLDVIRAADMARSTRDRRLGEAMVNLRARFPYKSA